MKRFWTWLGDFFHFSPGHYRFLRQRSYKYKEGRVAVFVTQRVYRRWRYCRRRDWYGAAHIKIRVVGVRLVYHGLDNEEPILGKILAATEEYTLRRDADYIYLLRHLLFMREACNLTEAEHSFVHNFKTIVMRLWPPRSGLDIRVCNDAFKDLGDGLP